jgi:hypothetical protein
MPVLAWADVREKILAISPFAGGLVPLIEFPLPLEGRAITVSK